MIIYKNGTREIFQTTEKPNSSTFKETIQEKTASFNNLTQDFIDPSKTYNGDYFLMGIGYGPSYSGVVGYRLQFRKGLSKSDIFGFGIDLSTGIVHPGGTGGLYSNYGLKMYYFKNLYIFMHD